MIAVRYNYLILYRVLGEVVETVRVFHGARDLAAIFRDDRK
jgi:plasmid stabilization system protein ParE